MKRTVEMGAGIFSSREVRRLVQLAIDEDLAHGDITSELSIPSGRVGTARVLARVPLVVCGLPIIDLIVRELGWDIKVTSGVSEGRLVRAGALLASLRGQYRALLGIERTALNFIQRMSGVATYTSVVVDRAGPITVLDTRKTTPGWRLLEKYAVRCGGGANHRGSLSEMVLVKNNHIDAHPGGVVGALEAIFAGKPRYLPVEVEVRDVAELRLALSFPVSVVMLDNMDDRTISRALSLVKRLRPGLDVEVSGGIEIERLKSLAKLGVRCVSMGALTNQATSVDISMRVG